MGRYGRLLTDVQWKKIRPLLPKRPPRPRGGRPPSPNAIIWTITSTVSRHGDTGADPNRLVVIADSLNNTDPTVAADETFYTLRIAGFAEVLRGSFFTAGTESGHEHWLKEPDAEVGRLVVVDRVLDGGEKGAPRTRNVATKLAFSARWNALVNHRF